MKKLEGIYIGFEQLTTKEELNLFSCLKRFASEQLPGNKDLMIELVEEK